MRTTDLFRDWDEAHKGHLLKADFMRVIKDLGLKHSDDELGGIFDCWDVRTAGQLEFRDVDRVIRGAKRGGDEGAQVSAMDIQKQLNERLQVRASPNISQHLPHLNGSVAHTFDCAQRASSGTAAIRW